MSVVGKTVGVRACECRIGERQASRESAKYDRLHSRGYTLAYLANPHSLISTPFPLTIAEAIGIVCYKNDKGNIDKPCAVSAEVCRLY